MSTSTSFLLRCKCWASGPSRPHAGQGLFRPGAVTQRPRWTPTSRRSFNKCPTSGPSRPHPGEGLSRPRAITRRLRWTPTSRRSFQKCQASGPSQLHAGEGPSSLSPFQKLRKDSSPGHFDHSGHLPTWMIVSLARCNRGGRPSRAVWTGGPWESIHRLSNPRSGQ